MLLAIGVALGAVVLLGLQVLRGDDVTEYDGVVSEVLVDRSAFCIKTAEGEDKCAEARLTTSSDTFPDVGQHVTAGLMQLPIEDGKGAVESWVWVRSA